MQVIISVEEGHNRGHRKWIRSGEELTIGLSAWADLVIDSPEVLPIHAIVELTEDVCSLRCVEGGVVTVNGQSRMQTVLSHNDRIQLGCVVLRTDFHGVRNTEPPTKPLRPSVAQSNQNESALFAPVQIRATDFDSDFMCYEPETDSTVTAREFIERLELLAPVWLLCRFDRWTFPVLKHLQDCCDSVPESSNPQARAYLPLLFGWQRDQLTESWLEQGLDSGNLIVLASSLAKDELLSFLRDRGGLFLSPEAMHAVIPEMQDGALGSMLGPIDAILLGKAQAWQCYVKRQLSAVRSVHLEF